MKRFFYLILVAILCCGGLMFTSCSSDDTEIAPNPPDPDDPDDPETDPYQKYGDLIQHIQEDAKLLAENLNFDMVNTTVDINTQLLRVMDKGRNFTANIKTLIALMAVQNAVQHIKSVPADSELAKMGYTAYIPLDISSFGVRVVFDERGDYKVSPAEGLEYIFPATIEGVGKTVYKMSLKNNGEWYESVSPGNFRQVKGLACITRIPKAMTLTLSGLFDDKEINILQGVVNIEMENAPQSQYTDFKNSIFRITCQMTSALNGSQYGLPDDDSKLEFSFGTSEENQATINYFFTQKGMSVLHSSAQITMPDQKGFIEQLSTLLLDPSSLKKDNLLLTLANVFNNCKATLNATILDDLMFTADIADGTVFFQALQNVLQESTDSEVTQEVWNTDVEQLDKSCTLLISYKDAPAQTPLWLLPSWQSDSHGILPSLKIDEQPLFMSINDLVGEETVGHINKVKELSATPVSNAVGVDMQLCSRVLLMMPMNSEEWGF